MKHTVSAASERQSPGHRSASRGQRADRSGAEGLARALATNTILPQVSRPIRNPRGLRGIDAVGGSRIYSARSSISIFPTAHSQGQITRDTPHGRSDAQVPVPGTAPSITALQALGTQDVQWVSTTRRRSRKTTRGRKHPIPHHKHPRQLNASPVNPTPPGRFPSVSLARYLTLSSLRCRHHRNHQQEGPVAEGSARSTKHIPGFAAHYEASPGRGNIGLVLGSTASRPGADGTHPLPTHPSISSVRLIDPGGRRPRRLDTGGVRSAWSGRGRKHRRHAPRW